MKRFPVAVSLLALVALVVISCTSKKSPSEELTDRLLDRAVKEAQRVDPRRVEAEISRLSNQLTPQQRDKIKQEARRILDRL